MRNVHLSNRSGLELRIQIQPVFFSILLLYLIPCAHIPYHTYALVILLGTLVWLSPWSGLCRW